MVSVRVQRLTFLVFFSIIMLFQSQKHQKSINKELAATVIFTYSAHILPRYGSSLEA